MAGAVDNGAGVDLEKELTCSICTDVLYQPLTLLDCLHTFCGSCLKEWFSWQAASAARTPRATSPYTCPSCRAAVRAVRPNAGVTTLLDMFMQANPGKGKTEAEKEEMRKHYKPGDDVLPPVQANRDEDDSEDERLMEDVMQMSVADLDPAVAANRRAGRSTIPQRERDTRRPQDARRREAAARHEVVERNIAHQPSLRSLLSASGDDSEEVQEILNSIMSSGVFDGIDIDNLTAEQEEDLTERIAEAYLRRHSRRERQHRAGGDHGSRPTTGNRSPNSAAATHATPPRSRPPGTRTHLIEQWTQDTAQSTRRPSAESRRDHQSASHVPPPTRPAPSVSTVTRSATEPPRAEATPETGQGRRRTNGRSNTDDVSTITHRQDPRSETASSQPSHVISTSAQSQPIQTPPSTSRDASAFTPPYPVNEAITHARAQSQTVGSIQSRPDTGHQTTIVDCSRCSRPGIQHDLHYKCTRCRNGTFNLCLHCYRAGQGCDHWFGFGYAAMMRWSRNAPPGGYPPSYERPHVLVPRRVRKTSLPGTSQLEEGAFCETCFQYADDSYWHCSTCFEGAWGFCASCVHQDRHCAHPLTPVTRVRSESEAQKVATGSLRSMPLPHLPMSYYFSLPRCECAVCNRSIPALHTRLHCARCRDGKYDICNDSYDNLVATGKISVANGPSGQRRCLQGHPLTIVAFRNLADDIQQRLVVSDAVGGWEAKHRLATVQSGTSSGELGGGKCVALWSWFPSADVEDELAFPKFAEITEIEKANEDYYLGVYAGNRGLFPANHVKMM